MNETLQQIFRILDENKKAFGVIGAVLVFGRKIYRRIMIFVNTGKKILSAIEQTSHKIDTLQSDMIELKQETSITNALIKASKDLEDIGIFDANHRGEITWVNSYFLKIMGVQREDMLKNRWHEYIDANHKSAVVKVWKDKVVEGDKIYIKTVFVDYMGNKINVTINAHPVSVNQEIYGYTGTIKVSV